MLAGLLCALPQAVPASPVPSMLGGPVERWLYLSDTTEGMGRVFLIFNIKQNRALTFSHTIALKVA
jgi:hypothetical protein